MASNGPLETNINVNENGECGNDFSDRICENDISDSVKRRRIAHDYKKLSKLGYVTDALAVHKPANSPEIRGK